MCNLDRSGKHKVQVEHSLQLNSIYFNSESTKRVYVIYGYIYMDLGVGRENETGKEDVRDANLMRNNILFF